MSSKKNGSKKLFENMPVEPEHNPEETHADATPQLPELKEEKDVTPVQETVQPSGSESEDASLDDLLEDVRHSLMEEEAEHEKQEQPKWWKRLGRNSRKNAPAPEPPPVIEEINLPGLEEEEHIEEPEPEPEPELDEDPINDLIVLLDQQESEKPRIEEKPAEPEKAPDLEELKKQAFQPRAASAQDENLTEVRSIALDGGEEVFVEVESKPQDPLEERLSAMENALKPYQRYLNFGLAFLGLVMAVIAALVLFNLYQRSVAATVATQVPSDLPYPTSISLPGGWKFQLGKGSLTSDGRWDPKEAEWLQGTEVCRWVALPWSKQLEAVLRTLNPNDPIDLGMSNNDVLTYKVYSIKQMSPAEMQKLDSNSPCLLVVLPEQNAEKRWVLTALP